MTQPQSAQLVEGNCINKKKRCYIDMQITQRCISELQLFFSYIRVLQARGQYCRHEDTSLQPTFDKQVHCAVHA